MALRINIDASDIERLGKYFQHAPELVTAEVRRFIENWTEHLRGEVSQRAPTSGAGLLRGSIIGDVQPIHGLGVERAVSNSQPVHALGWVGIISTSSPYAVPVEFGTKPHNVSKKGRESLADWARRKLGVSEEESERVSFLISRKIRRFGTEGHFMFRDTLDANEAEIIQDFHRLVGRIEDSLTDGKV